MDAGYFDEWYAEIGKTDGLDRFSAEQLGVPVEVGPQNLVPMEGLEEIAAALTVESGGLIVDIACGRGGPGMWLARKLQAELLGVDFSPEAIAQATVRRELFGLVDRAAFAVGTLESTGLAAGVADAVVCVDAFQFAPDPVAAAEEMRRLLRPGGRLTLTTWKAKDPNDEALPERLRSVDPRGALDAAGFIEVDEQVKPAWDEIEHSLWTRAAALEIEAHPDLASIHDEAVEVLPTFDRRHRLMVTATAP